MLKCIKNLCESKKDKHIKNHEVFVLKGKERWHIYNEVSNKRASVVCTRVFRYYNSPICCVNDVTKVFYLSHADWWTTSTKNALDSYRQYFESLGYKNVWNIPIYEYERRNNHAK